VSAGYATDLCRVTLVAPQGRFDVALPASVPLAYLVPTLLQQAGENLAEAGVEHGGWAVQRLAGWPLDTGQSPAALGISDGEILYLRPRRAELPTPVFDDSAEAISRTLAEQTPRWNPAASRAAGLVAGVTLLAAGVAALLVAGPPWRLPAVAAGLVAALLLVAAGLVSRAADDAVAGALLGCGAGLYGAVAGILALAGQHASPLASSGGLLAGAAVGLVLVVMAGASVGAGAPVFAAAAVVALSGMVAGLVELRSTGAGAAAAALGLAFLLMPFIPTIAYRSAGLPRPFVPESARELRRGATPLPAEELAQRTLLADLYLSSLVAACAAVTVAAVAVLVTAPGWAGPALAGMAALLALLRARVFTGRAQRVWLVVAATASTALLVAGRAARLTPAVAAPGIVVAAAIVAVIVIALSTRPARRSTPPVARMVQAVEVIVAVATLPLVLDLVGVYGMLRSMTG
jgi:type VII secretion integral membrane protein EccD